MRSRAVVIGIGSVALVLAACASSPSSSTSTAPPVRVVVSADEEVRLMVNTDKIREVTEAALRKYAPHAAEATITIHFNSLGVVKELTPGTAIMTMPNPGTPVLIASSEPWNEPSQPTVGGSSTAFTPTQTWTQRPVVKGTYTITDASGTVLEQRSIAIPPTYREIYTQRLDEQRSLAADVAKRVAALRTQ